MPPQQPQPLSHHPPTTSTGLMQPQLNKNGRWSTWTEEARDFQPPACSGDHLKFPTFPASTSTQEGSMGAGGPKEPLQVSQG